MAGFLKELAEQRWDDHRFYHHSRVNQSLHLLSALCFLCSYVLLFTHPVAAALVGWLLAMISRQVGHFFFEPKGFDEANQVTHEYKEDVKVGYNLRRKVALLSIWGLCPVALLIWPTAGGLLAVPVGLAGYLANLSTVWIALGVGAVLFRTVHLFFLRDVQTGLVWLTKILTDPFHDIMLYHRAPLHLLRGEWIEPIGAKTA
jgi:hypothetical protein